MADVSKLAKLSNKITFNSYDDFEKALYSFSRENCVVFCFHKSESIESANKKLLENVKPYDMKFQYHSVRLKCKHGGEKRSNGLDIRSNQRYKNWNK